MHGQIYGIMPLRVLVSSVSSELRSERDALRSAIEAIQQTFDGMELFVPDRLAPAQVSIDAVHRCDLFVGIYGFDYGDTPPGSDMSFTELEYRTAVELHRPMLLCVKKARAHSINAIP